MAICDYCDKEMTSEEVKSCTETDVTYTDGKRARRLIYKSQAGERCHDCGVADGGWHHPGCDMDLCPICGGQQISCGHIPDWDDLEMTEEEISLLGGGRIHYTNTGLAGSPDETLESLHDLRLSIQAVIGDEEYLGRWADGRLWEAYEKVLPIMRARGLSPISAWYTVAQTIAQEYEALASKITEIKRQLPKED